MAADRDMVALFKAELALCKVSAGEAVGVVSEDRIRQDYAEAFLAAAEELGAHAAHVNVRKRPGSFFGPGNSLQGNRPAIEALKKTDIVIDLMGLLWSKEQTEITDAGARMLLVVEPIDVLRRMFPRPDARPRVEAGARMLAAAKTLRVTSPAGTDVTYHLGKYRVAEQYGFTDQPGRWDAWPGTFLYTAAFDDGVDGTVVIDVGDMLLPFMRYVSSRIVLKIEAGQVVDISGDGVDAQLMKTFMKSWNDPRAFAVSHIGWGLDDNASWEYLGTSPHAANSGGQDGRAFYGNVLFSTGPNIELGGTNDTPSHLDIPLKGCTLELDGVAIVRDGDVVPAELRAPGR
ncbi:MAG: leucyl aminopeptidase [Rhodospirillaceae bacterium]